MNKFPFFISCLFVLAAPAEGQSIQVPSEIEFAGMQLVLTSDVRKTIQADVDAITRNPKYFQIKVERADLYFPLIEKIFREEELPSDFKFLALQESSLVSDAVSTSNAVGYWQFKKESAQEVGLRVDSDVDERMNIIASSRGAAKYLKRNNFHLNNWVYALLSYNLGLGGVKPHVQEKNKGAKRMTIDKDMHWYVTRFLAHKLAYENEVGKNYSPALRLMEYSNCPGKTLKDIARETSLPAEDLEHYNKWLLCGRVPADKTYVVILPVKSEQKDVIVHIDKIIQQKEEIKLVTKEKTRRKNQPDPAEQGADIAMFSTLNGIDVIRAREGDDVSKLALRGGIPAKRFLEYNDMKSFEVPVPGNFYFLKPKKSKALVMFHTLQKGESLRDVSQMYGIRINDIRKKNRMKMHENPEPGRVLWLRSKRPANIPVEIKKTEVIKTVPAPVIPEKEVLPEKKEEMLPPVTEPASVKLNIPETELRYHEVKQGETFYSISRMYNIPIDSLKAWNGDMDPSSLKPGVKLVTGKSVPEKNLPEKIIHIVAQGETLYKISGQYKVSIDEILKWNNKTSQDLNIGESLIIYKRQ